MTAKWEVMESVLQNGERERIIVDALVGAWAIHQRVWGGEAVGPGWTVSHQPSGIAVWQVETEQEALRVARFLDESKILPETREAFLEWRVKASGPDKSKVMEQLSNIARRFHPHGYPA